MTTQVDKTRPREVKRKLAAILSADVKGYSRLMGEDEEGTIRTLNAYKEVLTGFIQKHQGRVVGTAGDSMLAEFASVVDAVRCAVGIQEELKDRNKELSEDRRMEFRIGVNLGDVVEGGDTIYGDGVNIAARLESLSEAGGICISGTAYDQVENKLSLGYEYLGEQAVKNIAKPVRVYRVLMEPEAAGKVIGEKKAKPGQRQRAVIGSAAVVIVVVAVIIIWRLYAPPAPKQEVASKEKITTSLPEKPPATTPPSPEVAPKEKVTPPLPEKVTKPAPPPAPKMEVASKEKMAFPLPDVPSIAVLPFVNMSRDPEQEYFSDGVTEEIITALSKIPKLFVIARNSTFTYKGKPVKVKQVSEGLGVRYVLEGSVRKTGDKVRITAQLIDALTGHHLWAERYDRNLKDIFVLQDEITMKIISALQVKLTVGETAHVVGKGTENLNAYLKGLQAREQFIHMNKQGITMAKQLAKEAIALDPKYAFPYTVIADCHILEVWLRFSESPQESMKLAVEAAQKAMVLDNSDPNTHVCFTTLYIIQKQYDKAIASAERASELGPGVARARHFLGRALMFACRFSEAIQYMEEANRLDPFPPATYFASLSVCYRFLGRDEEALAQLKKAQRLEPNNLFTILGLVGMYTTLGRMEEAHAAAAEVLRLHPKFSLEDYAKTIPFKDQSVVDIIIGNLRKAGLK